MWRSATRRASSAAAATLAALLVVGLGACGGGSQQAVRTTSWAESFCQSYRRYESQVARLGGRLQQALVGSPTPLATRKRAVVAYLSAVVAETDGFTRDLDGAGTPDVTHGAALVAAIGEGFAQLRAALASAHHRAEALSPTDRQAFSAAASEVSRSIGSGSRQSRATIVEARARFGTPALDRAFTHASACAAIA